MLAKGMVCVGGSVVGLDFGAPNVVELAIMCMRQCRFAGSLNRWWPVGMHQILVAEICENICGRSDLVLDCLLHDSPEAVFGDTPSPVKTYERRKHEHALLDRIYKSFSIEQPKDSDYRVIKAADVLSLLVESQVMGHQAFTPMLNETREKTADSIDVITAKHLLDKLLVHFNPLEALKASGRHVEDYRNRLYTSLLYRTKEQK